MMKLQKQTFVSLHCLILVQAMYCLPALAQSYGYQSAQSAAPYENSSAVSGISKVQNVLSKIPYVNRYSSAVSTVYGAVPNLPASNYVNRYSSAVSTISGAVPRLPDSNYANRYAPAVSQVTTAIAQTQASTPAKSIFDLVSRANSTAQKPTGPTVQRTAAYQPAASDHCLNASDRLLNASDRCLSISNPLEAPKNSDQLYRMENQRYAAQNPAASFNSATSSNRCAIFNSNLSAATPTAVSGDKWGLSRNFPLAIGGDDAETFAFPSEQEPQVYQRKRGSATDNNYSEYSVDQFFKDHSTSGGHPRVRGSRSIRK